ncbi:DUF4142 domain-containing protein [Longitalea luteola]|uniref:DUF4142 domain-containing protein n=1 Tax=Longitalea luteola TaxID=2812563 RepID=UPI001A972B63|nr:DUF4142 domain-containing protein [Longitalea luteola]
MKTTIFYSFAVCAMTTMFACQSPTNNDGTNADSTGAIRSAPTNTGVDRDMDRDMAGDSARAGVGTTGETGVGTTGEANRGALDDRTQKFMNEAAMGGMAEVQLGKLAQERATNARVKNFAEMMVREHSEANNELQSIAQRKNLNLRKELEGEHKDHYEDLSKKKGADFDRAYMKMMVDDHQDDINAFEKAAENGTDPDIKTFASQKLPTLRKHLDSAKAIQKSLKQ